LKDETFCINLENEIRLEDFSNDCDILWWTFTRVRVRSIEMIELTGLSALGEYHVRFYDELDNKGVILGTTDIPVDAVLIAREMQF